MVDINDLIMKIVEQKFEQMKKELLEELHLSSKIVDVPEAAEILNVSQHILYKMCATKAIPHIRLGSFDSKRPKLKFRVNDLHKWLAEESQKNYRR